MARILKQGAEKLLARVPEEQVFRCSDGRMLWSMRELEEGLKSMSDEIFVYHSNELRTDFSNWVRDVIGDEKLARDLSKAPNRIRAAKSTASRIAFLDSKLA